MRASYLNRIAQPDNYLPRPQLEAKLTAILQKKLIVVKASGGFGKTLSVGLFLQKKELETIWVPLSELDNNELRLWEKFANRLSYINKRLERELVELGFPNSFPSFERVIKFISLEAQRLGKLVLVLDDLHLITNRSVLHFFELLIKAEIPFFSTIIITRGRLPASISMRTPLAATLTEADLRFTAEEATEYFKLQNVRLSSKVISHILDYSNGSIVLLYLIGLSLKRQNNTETWDIPTLRLDTIRLMDEYAFSSFSEELQHLLVTLSLLENFPYELVFILTTMRKTVMDELLLANTFISFDSFSSYLEIHPLFLEFLRSRQYLLSQQEITEVHRTAAEWYYDKEFYTDAVVHYQKVGEYEKIAEVLVSFPNACTCKLAEFGIRVIRAMPEGFVDTHPRLALTYAKFLLNNFIIDEAKHNIEKLIHMYEQAPPCAENQYILGEAYILFGFYSMWASIESRQNNFVEYFKKAGDLLPQGSKMFDNTLQLTACGFVNAVRDSAKGELDKRLDDMRLGMRYAAEVMHGCCQGVVPLMDAEKAFYQFDILLATKFAHQALSESRQVCQHDIEDLSLFYLMRIAFMRGDFIEAQARLSQISHDHTNSTFYVIRDIYEAWYYLALGYPEKIACWLKEEAGDPFFDSPITFSFERLIRAKYYLQTQRYYELFGYLAARREYNMEDFFLGGIEIAVIKAIAYYNTDDKIGAARELEKAYELAQPNRILSPFIENGNAMRTLVSALLKSQETRLPEDWLNNILTKSSTYTKKRNKVILDYQIHYPQEQPVPSMLSRRESQVLNDISLGMTREEIADNNRLSINTIKNITKSVYEKLGASNAYEAIRIAALKKILHP